LAQLVQQEGHKHHAGLARKEEVCMHDIGPTTLESASFEHGRPWDTGELGGQPESPFTDIQEMELASALLEAGSEVELEQFLGDVFRTVGGAAGRFVRSDTGRTLAGILKDAAKQALPVVGSGVGRWISPTAGGPIGADIGRVAGRIFGLELEGLSPEDKEFEVARQFVRFAGAAVNGATQAPPTASPAAAAQAAAAQAARVHAPGFLSRLQGRSGLLWPRSGRWVRQGRTIVLYGT
jgi:hypothetical protein